jgi:hypothetical protein
LLFNYLTRRVAKFIETPRRARLIHNIRLLNNAAAWIYEFWTATDRKRCRQRPRSLPRRLRLHPGTEAKWGPRKFAGG